MKSLPRASSDVFDLMARRFTATLRDETLRIAHDSDDADDIVQETWLRALDNYGQFSGRGSLEGWLRRICRNVAIDWIRSRTRMKELDGVAPEMPIATHLTSPDVTTAVAQGRARQGLCDLVDDTILSLPSLQRNVAALRWHLGWPTSRIASYLGVAPGTVKSELFRARAKLRNVLLERRDLAAVLQDQDS